MTASLRASLERLRSLAGGLHLWYGEKVGKLFEADILAALEAIEQDGWVSVKERIPEFEELVQIVLLYPNGKRSWCLGMRGDGEDGWLWNVQESHERFFPFAGEDTRLFDVECDDDYNVTHWRKLPAPPSQEDGPQ